MYYVYILQLENGDLYKGSTASLRQRILRHRSNNVESTKGKKSKLIYYECYLKKTDAERKERFLKTTEGRRLLKQQLRDYILHRSHSLTDKTLASEAGD